MPVIPITDLDDPRLQVYRDLKGRPASRQGDFFVVEGSKTVARLLASDYETASVLVIQKRIAEWEPLIPADIPCLVVPDDLGSQLVGFNFHVGVVACGVRRPALRLEHLRLQAAERLTLVVCPSCDNPENLGAIIRISSGFGVDAILLGSSCCDPFSRRVLRVSMGTALRMPLIESRNLARDLDLLRNNWGVELAATILSPTAEPLHTATRPPRLALLFGNEDAGLEPEWLAYCQRQLTIPMAPGTDSLNVAIASAIFLHHFTRYTT